MKINGIEGLNMSQKFSRRDALKTGAVGLLGGLVACSPLRTIAVGTVTAIPDPTETKSPTETPTRTPTKTATPTETPIPLQFEEIYGEPTGSFKANFNKGFAGFDDITDNIHWRNRPFGRSGASLEIIDDPTGKFGKVLEGRPAEDAYWNKNDNVTNRRGYVAKWFHDLAAPVRLTEWIWINKKLCDLIRGPNKAWWSHMTFLDRMAEPGYDGKYWHPTLTTGMSVGAEHMNLNFQREHDKNGIQAKGAPKFTPDEWHCMVVDIDEKGHTRLFQDDELVSEGNILKTNDVPPYEIRKADNGSPIFQQIRGGPWYTGTWDTKLEDDPFTPDMYARVAELSIEWWKR
jgi:hypothetical protein